MGLAARLCDVRRAAVVLVGTNEVFIPAGAGVEPLSLPRNHLGCGETLLSEDPTILEDVEAWGRRATCPLLSAMPAIRFYASVPLRPRSASQSGAVVLLDERTRTLTPAQWGTLEALGRQALALMDLAGATVAAQRIRADAGLQESEERFVRLAHAATDAVWDWDLKNETVWWSESLQHLFGYSSEEVASDLSWWYRSIHPDDRDRVFMAIRATIDRGDDAWVGEYRFARADGTFADVYDRGFIERDGQGSPRRAYGGMIDVTARKAAEAALRESEERFRATFDQAAVGICHVDTEQRFALVNDRFCAIVGYAREELLRRRFTEITHPADRNKGLRLFHRLLNETLPHYTIEKRCLRGDGTVVWVNLTVSLMRNADGTPRMVVGVVEDITERRRMQCALRENERHLRIILEHVPAIVWTVSTDLRIASCLGAGLAGVGLAPGELNGQLVSEVFNDDGVRNPAVKAHLKALLGVPTTLELRWRNRVYHGHIEPLHDEGQVITGCVGMGFDVTDRKGAEEALRRYSEELEGRVRERTARLVELEAQRRETEKLAAAGRMAARVAHEINNPLGGIKNAFLLVKDAIPESHKHYSYVPRILHEIDRIARIVRQMYDLYRPEQDMARRFPADQALHDIVAFLEPYSRQKRVSFDVKVDPQCCWITLPEGPFRQVMYNLLQNAIDASPEGEPVHLDARKLEDAAVFSIRDHGPGIPQDVRPHVFEPFFSTKSGERGSGLGLGLSVCKGLAEGMGGTLSFECGSSGGTTFRLAVPLKSPSEGGCDGAAG